MGLIKFYRKFVHGYATIASPLIDLLKHDGFSWSKEAQVGLEKLEKTMVAVLVLGLPDFSKPFQVYSDASGTGMGVVLMQ